ncbi:hypothetical protein ACTU45_17200 [Streptomyces sp. 24-1644]|uniref:hypothetical protein n=1 Tax=Streptomyces sp. 24-1644 TaxID=3457315 RepID=UPI003FA72C44
MKGDRVGMVTDAGDTIRTYEVVASTAGRRVETAVRRGVVEVSEVTLPHSPEVTGGAPLDQPSVPPASWRTRVLALVERPVPREDASERPLRDVPKV